MVENRWAELDNFEETRGLSRIQGIKLYNMRTVGLPMEREEMLLRLVHALEPPDRDRKHIIYISYFSDNANFATRIADQLNDENCPVWIASRNSTVGEDWRNEQARAMLASRCHLVALRPGITCNEFLKTEVMLSEAIGIPAFTILEPEHCNPESIEKINNELRHAELTFRRLFDRHAFRVNEDDKLLNQKDVAFLRGEARSKVGLWQRLSLSR
ncbi:MAG: toll/interleukin-1 receptor domain-containing protein [Alphaproteobacteria bacterium]|nr:toll/interleukin-1 receptor domain-containing protein [Alphaproteobacteria bacterium]